MSVEEKRETLLRLYEAGILQGEDGKVSITHKNNILEAFGLETLDKSRDVAALHIQKAAQEHVRFEKEDCEVDDFDDHALHIVEHTRHLLSLCLQGEVDDKRKYRVSAHLKAHEQKQREKE